MPAPAPPVSSSTRSRRQNAQEQQQQEQQYHHNLHLYQQEQQYQVPSLYTILAYSIVVSLSAVFIWFCCLDTYVSHCCPTTTTTNTNISDSCAGAIANFPSNANANANANPNSNPNSGANCQVDHLVQSLNSASSLLLDVLRHDPHLSTNARAIYTDSHMIWRDYPFRTIPTTDTSSPANTKNAFDPHAPQTKPKPPPKLATTLKSATERAAEQASKKTYCKAHVFQCSLQTRFENIAQDLSKLPESVMALVSGHARDLERLNMDISWTRHAQPAAAPEPAAAAMAGPAKTSETNPYLRTPPTRCRRRRRPTLACIRTLLDLYALNRISRTYKEILTSQLQSLSTLRDTLAFILQQTQSVESDIKALLAMPPPPKVQGENQLYDFAHTVEWRGRPGEVIRWDSLGEEFRERILAWSEFTGDIEPKAKANPFSNSHSNPNYESGWLYRFSAKLATALRSVSSSSSSFASSSFSSSNTAANTASTIPTWDIWNDRNQGSWNRLLRMSIVVQGQIDTVEEVLRLLVEV